MFHISWSFLWLGILIVSIVVEAITCGLMAIWLGFGAIGALVAKAAGAGVDMQIGVFLAISFLTSYFLRPYVLKLFNYGKIKKNRQALIGQKVSVIAPIDNHRGEGKVYADHMEWRARADRDEYVFAVGDTAVIVRIDGVVLVVCPDIPADHALVGSVDAI